VRPKFETENNTKERRSKMYSPKVKEDLIPILYKLAKQEGKPMTALIDEMLRAEIAKRNEQLSQMDDETVPVSVKKTTDDEGS
jgi:hypothetical protein